MEQTNGALLLQLESKITYLRLKLISTGQMKGLNHPDTIKCSQELDHILNEYERVKRRV
ncbi:aspartyl-phosphate phosphatase Spo0E family protein [Halalkalibacter urbisdiaboli]|uniref:aspartyl-phosphate phosphatase Spo0E family protein n=1 Tax=Halalkalibacter urbisdiaboli TaxID=1960589 RepID=UPI000B4361E1|nr:aspartyl-phosphate phosphatase Spo0E family protein [Halalkalibacter urbisdiaboli]